MTFGHDVSAEGRELQKQAFRPAAQNPSFYRPELDALRFFAFLMVFLGHCPIMASWYRHIREVGFLGVEIFFCLSAYLIVTLLLRELERTHTVRLRAFAIRRALRIWPLYFLVVGLAWLWGLRWAPAHIDGHMLLALSLMYANLWIGHVGWQHLAAIGPVWSISVEEQFYLGIPLIIRLGGRRMLWVVCGSTLIASYVVLFFLARKGLYPMGPIWTNSFVQFQFFACGGVIALVCYGRRLRISGYQRAILFIVGCGLLLAATKCGIDVWAKVAPASLLAGYLCALLGVAAIFVSVLDLPKHPPAPTIYLGKISYGLYMYHYPFLWLAFVLFSIQFAPLWVQLAWSAGSLMLTICIAALSYRFLEAPILKYKRRFETVKTRPV